MLVEGNATAAGRTRCSESSNGILFVVRETAATKSCSSTADTDPTMESKGGSASSSSASVVAGGGGGGMGSDGGGVEVDGEPSRLVTVRNLRPRRRVVVAVVNVSMYFSVTPVPTRCLGAAPEDPADADADAATVDASAVFPRRDHSGGGGGGGGTTLGFRGWGQGLGASGAAGGIELFDVPAGESLTLRVTPRLDKLRSGTGLALLANEQSLEVRSRGGVGHLYR